MKDCPKLQTLVDHAPMKTARREFAKRFPNFVAVRNTVAHAAETTGSIARMQQQAFSGPVDIAGMIKGDVGLLTMKANLNNATFVATAKGQLVEYDITHETLELLKSIATQFYEGFIPVRIA